MRKKYTLSLLMNDISRIIKINLPACVLSEDSDQPVHPLKRNCILGYLERLLRRLFNLTELPPCRAHISLRYIFSCYGSLYRHNMEKQRQDMALPGHFSYD